jgi:hypothetical protein
MSMKAFSPQLILTVLILYISVLIQVTLCRDNSPHSEMIPGEITTTENIIINGDFTNEFLPWKLIVYPDLGAAATARTENGMCRISDISISNQPAYWQIELRQILSEDQINQLQSGATYVLSFDAISENNNRPCYVYFGLDGAPWTALVMENIEIKNQSYTYSYEFTIYDIFSSYKLSFGLGQDTSDVFFDNIRIDKKTDRADPLNSIKNGDFKSTDLNPWQLYLSDNVNQTANANIVNGECLISGMHVSEKSETWHIQLLQTFDEQQKNMIQTGQV